MKYSTTSLSAITLCVCMMLSHHTNGIDMRGAPSSFTNNNPNQMSMTAQQRNQQPNSNVQSGSINWNNAFRPILPVPQSNNQIQPQSAEEMIIHKAFGPNNKDLYIQFSGKYRFQQMQWPLSSNVYRYEMNEKLGEKNVLISCYKGKERYANAKRFYDYVDRIDDPEYQRRLDDILFKRIASGQTEDGEIGCFVLETHGNYVTMTSLLGRRPKFAIAKQIPNMVARIMKAVSILNEIGILYNSVGIDHIMVFEDEKKNIGDIKLINFDRSAVHEDFKELVANSGLSPSPKLTRIYQSFAIDVEKTGQFIYKLFHLYKKILNIEFQPDDIITPSQLQQYNRQRQSLLDLSKAMSTTRSSVAMLHFILSSHYDIISSKL